jgi:type IV secretion system protein VirB11
MPGAAVPLIESLLKPLAPWLADPPVEDIAINQPGEAWIRARGTWQHVRVDLDFDALEELAMLAGALRRQDVDATYPLLASELPNGERLQVCLPDAVPSGNASVTIRKHERGIAALGKVKQRYCTAEWNVWTGRRRTRSLAEPLDYFQRGDEEGFLRAGARNRLNILLAGPTGAGKTTLSKSILSEIDHSERLITIEDVDELEVAQPNVVRMLYSKGALGAASVTPNDLLQASLRMRPDRVLLQELRDDAAFTFVNQVAAGHPGSVTTIHGSDAGDVVRRLFVLVKSSEHGRALDDATLMELIAAAVDVILPLYESGGRFHFGEAWFVGDPRAPRLADLMRATT